MSATLLPHPAMSALQAEHVCIDNDLELRQDGRGHLSLEQKHGAMLYLLAQSSRLYPAARRLPQTRLLLTSDDQPD